MEGKDSDWSRKEQTKTQIESIDGSSGVAAFPGSDTDRCGSNSTTGAQTEL